jgi:hypothetical protein
MVIGTMTRLVALVVGGGKDAAAVGSILCTGLGAVAAILWLNSSWEEFDWLDILRLSATWGLLTVLFRALWIGIVIGGGWTAVTLDYEVQNGQPGVILLALSAAGPLVLRWWNRKARVRL